jgi:putative DNA primase/helicase
MSDFSAFVNNQNNEVPSPIHLVPPPPGIPSQIMKAIKRGWQVFPLRRGTKSGYYKTTYKDGGEGYSWQKQATNDLTQVTKWADEFPGCNWGARTGRTSGFWVLDIDSPEALKWVKAVGLKLSYLVRTGHKSRERYQAYIRQPEGVRIRTFTDILKGILGGVKGLDVRGDKNGYVVLPPSLHPDGNLYEIISEGELPDDSPQSLLDLVNDERPEQLPVDIDNLPELTEDQKRTALNIFNKRCRAFADTPSDIWNDQLNLLGVDAGKLEASGVLTREEAELKVLESATGKVDPREFKATFGSGFKYGKSIGWDPETVEDYLQVKDEKKAKELFTKLVAEPAGVSPLPPVQPVAVAVSVQGDVTLNPEERMLANLATQHAVALIFTKRMSGRMLYDRTARKWLTYDGVRWSDDRLGRVHNFILGVASEMNSQNKAAMVSSSFCDGVNRHLQSFPEFACTTDQFDRDNYLLNTPAGTIDLRTGLTRSHNPGDMLTKCTLESPGAVSDGTHFRKFIMEICENDEELVRFHQISLGAILSGAMEDHWMLFWTGVGRNGKNTLGELVQYVMGDYAKKIAASTLMSKKFQGHSEEIADLHGFRLAISSELNDGEHWDEARINEFTGDATLSARHMYGSRFQFARTHKHLIYANYKPQLRSVSDGIRSRIKIVPFKVSFLGREDKDLPSKLRGELSYVLQWLISGHQEWIKAGKKLPKCLAVESETSEYFDNQSTPQLWLKERCDVLEREERPDLQLHTIMELYRDYKDWATSRGEYPLAKGRWQTAVIPKAYTFDTRRGKAVRRFKLRPPEYLPFGLAPGVPSAAPVGAC